MEIDIMMVGHYLDKNGKVLSFLTAEALSDLAYRNPDKFRFDKKRGVLVCIKPEIIQGFDESKLIGLSAIGRIAAATAKKLKAEL